jgi:hypothetical protein
MSSFPCESLDWDQENGRAPDYLVPIYFAETFHIVELPIGLGVAGTLLK